MFEECSSLKEATFPSMEHYLGYCFGSTDEKQNSRYVPALLYKVTILGGEEIPDYAFDGCLILPLSSFLLLSSELEIIFF